MYVAILKHRLKRKTDDGAFDTIHLETSRWVLQRAKEMLPLEAAGGGFCS